MLRGNRITGGAFFIAGTAIGSGVLALPMVFAGFGIIYSTLLMLVIWLLSYYAALFSMELNLQAKQNVTLGELGRFYSGPIAGFIGDFSVRLLSYALLVVYLYGGAAMLQQLLKNYTGFSYNFILITGVYTAVCGTILSFSLKFVANFNKVLFYGMLLLLSVCIVSLLMAVNWSNLPYQVVAFDFAATSVAAPIAFTSFGYHIIFATLANYCKGDAKLMQRACLWGSFIPAVVYILWTTAVLGVINEKDGTFYHRMTRGDVDVGELVDKLGMAAGIDNLQPLVWCFAMLAILTSVIGVGSSLMNTWDETLQRKGWPRSAVISSLLAFVPAFLVALLIPKAFVKMLSFAGIILVNIAILMPLYLLKCAKIKKLHYQVLRYKSLLFLTAFAGIVIIVMELANNFFFLN